MAGEGGRYLSLLEATVLPLSFSLSYTHYISFSFSLTLVFPQVLHPIFPEHFLFPEYERNRTEPRKVNELSCLTASRFSVYESEGVCVCVYDLLSI